MLTLHAMKRLLGVMITAGAWMAATPAPAQLMTLHCNWGVGGGGGVLPTVWPNSTQVMMMPTVMDFGSPPFSTSQVAFISFETASQLNRDGGGVLRIIDRNCHEVASFPDGWFGWPLPPGCPTNLKTMTPRLAPASGLAVGNIDTNPDVEIVAVIDEPMISNHHQLIAFNLVGGLVGGHLIPKWCSTPLPPGDFIPKVSAPAIAQLDKPGTPGALTSEIIIDNKVFNANGALRFTGGVGGPRSRTAVVANVLASTGTPLPQVITGRGVYKSSPPGGAPLWTGTLAWQTPLVTNLNANYPAIAELDPASPGPEIVVTDSQASKVWVFSATGTKLAVALLPGFPLNKLGGPPMIGNAAGIGTVIGVAGTRLYTLFRYNPGTIPTLTPIWSAHTNDPSGQTTSTLYNTPTGPRIYYADQNHLWVFTFNGSNWIVAQSMVHASNTVLEGPVIAAFDHGAAQGQVIVAANNYAIPGPTGIRIFNDPAIGPARSFWNQLTYHWTNVTNQLGGIPVAELPSWLSPAHNTYRVQEWP